MVFIASQFVIQAYISFGISKITHWKQYLQEAQKLLLSLRKKFEFVLPVWQLRCKMENVYIDMIQFNYASKARKGLDHLQKDALELHC